MINFDDSIASARGSWPLKRGEIASLRFSARRNKPKAKGCRLPRRHRRRGCRSRDSCRRRPARKIPPFQNTPEITKDVLIMCNFTEEKLDMFLNSMKAGVVPQVALKAVLTAQNCFWTFAQLFQELEEEHRNFYCE